MTFWAFAFLSVLVIAGVFIIHRLTRDDSSGSQKSIVSGANNYIIQSGGNLDTGTKTTKCPNCGGNV